MKLTPDLYYISSLFHIVHFPTSWGLSLGGSEPFPSLWGSSCVCVCVVIFWGGCIRDRSHLFLGAMMNYQPQLDALLNMEKHPSKWTRHFSLKFDPPQNGYPKLVSQNHLYTLKASCPKKYGQKKKKWGKKSGFPWWLDGHLGLCRTFVFQLRTHRSLHLVRGGLGFLGNFPPQENSVQIMGKL